MTNVVPISREVKPPPATIYAADLAAPLGPVPWLCEGLRIAPGRPTVIVGEGGSRKSWLAMSIALACAADHRVLGRFDVRHGRAVHLDYEQGQRTTAERYQALARGLGVDLAAVGDRLGYRWRPMSWRGARALDQLCWHLEGFDFAIVDPLRGCIPGVDENSMAASAPLDLATAASERTGTTICFIDHAGKPPRDEQGNRTRKHSQRGHSSKLDASQTLIVLSAEKRTPTLVTCERNQLSGTDFDPFRFTLASHGGGLRLAEIDTPTPPTDEERFKRGVDAVLAVVRNRPGVASVEAICVAMPAGMKNVSEGRALVKQAVADRLIEKRTSGGYFPC